MSRSKGNGNGNVFKLSGNLALGTNDYNNDYSNVNRNYAQQDPTLNYQKSYNQVTNKTNQYNDMKYGNLNNNYDGSYSNQGRRNQNSNPSTKDYQYKGNTNQNNARLYGAQNIYSDPYSNSQNRISNNNQKYNQYPPTQQQQQSKYDYNYNDIGQKPQKRSSINQNSNNRPQEYPYQYSQGGKSKSNINSYNKISEQQKTYEYQPKPKAQSKIASYSNNRETQSYSQKNVQIVQKKINPTIGKKTNNREYDYQPQYNNQNNKSENQRKLKQKENVQIKEYDPSTFVQCRAGCGRKFNPDSVAKHQKICKKVFQKKRKQFNVQEQRIVSKDQVKLMKQGQIIERKLQQKKKTQNLPKWKAESLAFRAVLKSNKPGSKMTQQEKKILDQSTKVGHIQCKFCGRSFNQQAGKRHIPFCQEQQKKNAMKKRK